MNDLFDLIRCLHCGNLGTAAAQVAKLQERIGELRFNGLIYSLSKATPAQLREWTEKALHEPEYTDWAPTSLHPQRSGVYQVRPRKTSLTVWFAYYECITRCWYASNYDAEGAYASYLRGAAVHSSNETEWRGLAKDPAPKKLFLYELNDSARAFTANHKHASIADAARMGFLEQRGPFFWDGRFLRSYKSGGEPYSGRTLREAIDNAIRNRR